MKGFLLDENVPIRLLFSPSLPMIHSRDLGKSLSDSLLWEFARNNELVLVTKDADFSNRMIVAEPPPWVIHLRIGNMRKQDFHLFLARIWNQVESLLPSNKLILVYTDRIEAIS